MATTNINPPAESTTAVVGDVIRDAQELLSQQLAMFRAEIREDFNKTRTAAYPMVCGLAVAAIGGILLSLMLVHFVHWAFPDLPLWGAYGIVSAVLVALGAAVFAVGKQQFDSFNPLPDKTATTVKENLQWLTQPK